ncbi:predicted protein, partial [Nematostella vectensis]
THTDEENDPWWRVDLGVNYQISSLFIVNRADCCGGRLSSFEIRIGDSLDNNGNENPMCGSSYSIPTGGNSSIICSPLLTGRYVNIRIPGKDKILTLCEVEVYPTIEGNKTLN